MKENGHQLRYRPFAGFYCIHCRAMNKEIEAKNCRGGLGGEVMLDHKIEYFIEDDFIVGFDCFTCEKHFACIVHKDDLDSIEWVHDRPPNNYKY